jgi:hypothetical protein
VVTLHSNVSWLAITRPIFDGCTSTTAAPVRSTVNQPEKGALMIAWEQIRSGAAVFAPADANL